MTRIMVDDTRTIADTEIYTNVDDAMARLEPIWANHYNGDNSDISELWLDFDLGWQRIVYKSTQKVGLVPQDTSPIVDWLIEVAEAGKPFPVTQIIVHTGNGNIGRLMVKALKASGYSVLRGYFSADPT